MVDPGEPGYEGGTTISLFKKINDEKESERGAADAGVVGKCGGLGRGTDVGGNSVAGESIGAIYDVAFAVVVLLFLAVLHGGEYVCADRCTGESAKGD
jgi:hypothetical protein